MPEAAPWKFRKIIKESSAIEDEKTEIAKILEVVIIIECPQMT